MVGQAAELDSLKARKVTYQVGERRPSVGQVDTWAADYRA